MLPFTQEQFYAVFAAYNTAVWPLQWVAYLLGIVIVLLVFRGSSAGDGAIAVGLAVMWAWTGVVYHAMHFSNINPAALVFAGMFVLEAALLLYAARRRLLVFSPPLSPSGWIGIALIGYAMVLYPLLSLWAGHPYPSMPTFGITPCPTTLFTFGLLLLPIERVPGWLLAIPFAWALIGGSAALLLGVPQDWMLLVSSIGVAVLVLRGRRRIAPGAPAVCTPRAR
jgi:hypothetical protein